MFFSKSCEYALRSALFLAKNSRNGNIGIQTIANELDIPSHYLSKVLQILVKNSLVSSIKGRNGGFFLTENEINRPLIDIVQAIDGNEVFDKCGLGLSECSNTQPCPLHDDIKAYRENLRLALSVNTLTSLREDVVSGQTFLTRLK